jgi:hemoglobin
MKKDLKTHADVQLLVNSFYEKVKADPVIGPVFTEQFNVNWDRHLQTMYDFWENALFFTGDYAGNPIASHRRMHKKYPFRPEHFQAWLSLFTATVDEHFEGEKALLAKQRALSISTVMRIKVLDASKSM